MTTRRFYKASRRHIVPFFCLPEFFFIAVGDVPSAFNARMTASNDCVSASNDCVRVGAAVGAHEILSR
jgi:hypothetical protein